MQQVSISIDFVRIRALIDSRTAAAKCQTRARIATLSVALAIVAFLCAGVPAARAANFSCTWTDASDNWTTTGDWSGCNGTFPNNGGGNTYDATISTGDPTLTTAVTVGAVMINSPGAWSLSGSGATATVTSTLSNSGTVALQNGATLATGGAVTNSGTGSLQVDFSGAGGSSLDIGGTLTNSATGGGFGGVLIGNSSISQETTVTAANLSNTGSIEITGSATKQATLEVNSAAPTTWTGTDLEMSGDALLQFSGTGQIGTNGGTIQLFGPQAYVAAAGINNTSNSALSGLTSNLGTFELENGASVTTSGGLSNAGTLLVDGGGSLNVTGILSNSAAGFSGVTIGHPGVAQPTMVTAGGLVNTGLFTIESGTATATVISPTLSNTGEVSISGGTAQAALEIGSPAPATWTGSALLQGNALLQFTGTSQIGTIGNNASIELDSPQAFVAAAGINSTSNSALTGLTTIAGSGGLLVENGASVSTNAGLTISGTSGELTVSGGVTGSTLDIMGTLSNQGFVTIGTCGLCTGITMVTASALDNTGTVEIGGGPTSQAILQLGTGVTSIASGATLILNGPNAQVQVIGNPTNNSGLVNLSSNAGTLNLNSQGTPGLTVTTSTAFNNSGSLVLDAMGCCPPSGGSTFNIGGVLTNSGRIGIGQGTFDGNSASSNVTATGLINTGIIEIAGAAFPDNLTINGQASNSNSGEVDIEVASDLTVTGAGNAYLQAGSGQTIVQGTLTAPSINVTGGSLTLQKFPSFSGTVVGDVNVTGGTLLGHGIVSGNLNISNAGKIEAYDLGNGNTPATLTIDGNYAQSGGTFDERLNGTGIQVNEVNVANGYSVDLTGGDLEVNPNGLVFALGQMFNDIMTFQPDELSGTFATLQGGGNGNMVNLGNGLTLEALYNNAAGNISLEVVPTPVNNIITWNDATGNWTTDTTKWTPTGPPVATSEVVIGSTTNGNVTLNNSTTINSLTINPSNALTNTSGTSLTVSTTVGNSGSLTLGGNLSATGAVTNNAGAMLTMQGGTLSAASLTNAGTTGGFGTINPAIANTGLVQANGGTLAAQGGIQGTGNVTVDSAAALTIGANSTAGTLTQNGTLNLGANNVTVSSDYTNANFGIGNSFNKLAGVTGTGQILAAGPTRANMEVITGPDVTNGNTTTPTLGLGILHVGDSTAYQIANEGTTANPSLRGAIQTDVNGGNIRGNLLSGTGITAANFGPIAPGTSTTNYTVTAANPGLLSGQGVHFANNFGNVPEQTMSITGQVNNYAALALEQTGGDGILTGGGMSYDLDFGNVVRGSPTQEALLAILNDNPLADQAFTDLLSTSPSGAAAPFSLTGCSVNGLPGGDSQSCDVLFDTSSLGSFMDSVTFDVESSNASGYDQIIGDVTLNLDGDIVSSPVPEPGSIAVLVSGLFMLFFLVRREQRGR